MGTTKLHIWNLALAKAGISQQLVDTQSIDSPLAKIMNNLYPVTLNSFLQEHSWGFAKRIVALDILDDYDSIKWEYYYAYPDDCLLLRLVTSQASVLTQSEDPVPYEVFVREDTGVPIIGTNEPGAYGIYTTENVSEMFFPSAFTQAFATRLAAEVAMAHAGDRGKHMDLLQVSIDLAERAKQSDAQQNIQVVSDKDSKYTRVRL